MGGFFSQAFTLGTSATLAPARGGMENFIRSEHHIHQRYIPDDWDYNLVDELNYEAEDHHDPAIDWIEEGTGITSDMKEFWEKYQEGIGNDPSTIFDELDKAVESQERAEKRQSEKAQKQAEAEKIAAGHRTELAGF